LLIAFFCLTVLIGKFNFLIKIPFIFSNLYGSSPVLNLNSLPFKLATTGTQHYATNDPTPNTLGNRKHYHSSVDVAGNNFYNNNLRQNGHFNSTNTAEQNNKNTPSSY